MMQRLINNANGMVVPQSLTYVEDQRNEQIKSQRDERSRKIKV